MFLSQAMTARNGKQIKIPNTGSLIFLKLAIKSQFNKLVKHTQLRLLQLSPLMDLNWEEPKILVREFLLSSNLSCTPIKNQLPLMLVTNLAISLWVFFIIKMWMRSMRPYLIKGKQWGYQRIGGECTRSRCRHHFC